MIEDGQEPIGSARADDVPSSPTITEVENGADDGVTFEAAPGNPAGLTTPSPKPAEVLGKPSVGRSPERRVYTSCLHNRDGDQRLTVEDVSRSRRSRVYTKRLHNRPIAVVEKRRIFHLRKRVPTVLREAIALIGVLTGFVGEVPTAALMARQQRLRGLVVGSRRHQLEMVRAIDATGIVPVIDRTFDLTEITGAFRLQAAAGHFGKISLKVAD